MDKPPHTSALAKHRIEAFSDGIYAIAITLLVLDVKLPALPHGIDDEALRLRAWVLSGCALAAVLLGFIVPACNMLAMLPTALLSKYAKL